MISPPSPRGGGEEKISFSLSVLSCLVVSCLAISWLVFACLVCLCVCLCPCLSARVCSHDLEVSPPQQAENTWDCRVGKSFLANELATSSHIQMPPCHIHVSIISLFKWVLPVLSICLWRYPGNLWNDNSTTETTPVGFEPTQGDPIGLAGRRLNRSAKVSLAGHTVM